MKKLFLAALLCCLTSALFAQWAGMLKVVNNTPCIVHYQLLGAPAPSCAPSTPSAILSQPGLSTVVYPTTPVIGWPTTPPFAFNAARIFSGPTACATPVGMVFNPCAGSPQAWGYAAMTASCSFCTQVRVLWTPPSVPGGAATLSFN